MSDLAASLAREFDFPAAAVPEIAWNLGFCAALLQLRPRRPSIREEERAARRRLRANPDDIDAWCTLHLVQAGRAPVLFDARTREISIGKSTAHRDRRRRTEHQLNAAVPQLRGLWERYHPDRPCTRYSGSDGTQGGAFSGLTFISLALRQLGVHRTKCSEQALRFRLARLS